MNQFTEKENLSLFFDTYDKVVFVDVKTWTRFPDCRITEIAAISVEMNDEYSFQSVEKFEMKISSSEMEVEAMNQFEKMLNERNEGLSEDSKTLIVSYNAPLVMALLYRTSERNKTLLYQGIFLGEYDLLDILTVSRYVKPLSNGMMAEKKFYGIDTPEKENYTLMDSAEDIHALTRKLIGIIDIRAFVNIFIVGKKGTKNVTVPNVHYIPEPYCEYPCH